MIQKKMRYPKQGKFSRLKIKVAHRLMRFCLDQKLNREFLLKPLFFLYTQLIRNAYILEHKDADHHYIPQFLLERFKIPGSKKSIYEIKSGQKPQRKKIKKIACLANFYSYKDRGSKKLSDFLERQVFAYTLERYASRIINQILDETDDTPLTYLEESILSLFVSFQYVRTPGFFLQIKETLEYLHLNRGIPLETMTSPNFYKEVFFENKYKITSQSFIDFAVSNNLKLSGAEPLILSIAMKIGNDLGEYIYRLNLRVLQAKSPAFFYLSDSPAEILNLDKKRSIGVFIWEIKENPFACLPISPDVCIYYVANDLEFPPSFAGFLIEKSMRNGVYKYAYSDRTMSL